jgi:hypothetical protein
VKVERVQSNMNDSNKDISEHRAYENARLERKLAVPLEIKRNPETGELERYWNGQLKVTLKQIEEDENPTEPDKKKSA